MPVVPGSLDSLLFLFAGAFTAPSFRTFRFLVVGFLTRVGEHTVCGMLQAARLERVWHHSRAHYFFSSARWSADELGLLLLDFLIATFVGKEDPIRVAVDDSLFHRTGKQVYGARYQYDGSAPSGAGTKIGYGNNWVPLATSSSSYRSPSARSACLCCSGFGSQTRRPRRPSAHRASRTRPTLQSLSSPGACSFSWWRVTQTAAAGRLRVRNPGARGPARTRERHLAPEVKRCDLRPQAAQDPQARPARQERETPAQPAGDRQRSGHQLAGGRCYAHRQTPDGELPCLRGPLVRGLGRTARARGDRPPPRRAPPGMTSRSS